MSFFVLRSWRDEKIFRYFFTELKNLPSLLFYLYL